MEDILPVETSRAVIEEAVRHNKVVIIQAETGAGKSTRIPQYLLSVAERVIVTQPRRIAAARIAERVAEETGTKLGELVGYVTANKSLQSKSTRLLYCTDGVEVMRQLFGDVSHPDTIVVIDEAHEWNLNLELLVAWFKQRMLKDENLRLVLMSATVEADLLVSYFGDAEVLSAKGRTYPITEIKPKTGLLGSVKMLLGQQLNVLVFVPGKAEINRTVAQLKASGVDADVLPLHAGLSEAEQTACFLSYPRAKCIVSTNVAQTSITIPDIDAVVDSGRERRSELVEGVSGLYLRSISIADREQRKGRAGRVRPGIYIDCCPEPIAERSMFPKAPILNSGLEGLILQLACVGYKIDDFEFFHRPPKLHVAYAQEALKQLGCLYSDHTVTERGRLVNRIPLEFRFACMVASTYRVYRGVEYVDRYVLKTATLLQEGGIRNRKSDGWREYSPPLPLASASDVYIELSALAVAETRSLDELEGLGIDPIAYERVRDGCQRVHNSLSARGIRQWNQKRTDLHLALISGMSDLLYKRSLGAEGFIRVGSKGPVRKLPSDSLLGEAEYLVALPWNYQTETLFGPKTSRVLQAATAVTPELLSRIKRG